MNLAALPPSSPTSTIYSHQQGVKKEEGEQERWSIHTPPRHYAYVPSVTLSRIIVDIVPTPSVKLYL